MSADSISALNLGKAAASGWALQQSSCDWPSAANPARSSPSDGSVTVSPCVAPQSTHSGERSTTMTLGRILSLRSSAANSTPPASQKNTIQMTATSGRRP